MTQSFAAHVRYINWLVQNITVLNRYDLEAE